MNNNLLRVIAFSAISVASSTVWAAPVVLTFEGLGNLESINDYYNGGTGGNGSGPGPNYGISFSSNSLALIDSSAGGTGNTGNDPSGKTVAIFLEGVGDVMNVAAGFTDGFSFYYAAGLAGDVTVWSGLNGTGSLLSTITLSTTSTPYYSWTPIGATFDGTAESVVFGGSANYIAFDNITLGASTPIMSPVPLPASAPMFGVALLALVGFGYGLNRWVAPKGNKAVVGA